MNSSLTVEKQHGSEQEACVGSEARACSSRDAAGLMAGMAEPPSFDAAALAEQFPLLVEWKKCANPLVYLDNAATTQKPECVLEAMECYYRYYNANPLRGVYSLSKEVTQLYGNARKVVARFLNCDADEVVFTSGTTDSLNTVAFSWGMDRLMPGDEIVLSIAEHHSNLIPWQAVASRTGAKLVYVFSNEKGVIESEAWNRAIGPRTKVVAVAQVGNVVGGVAPVERICHLAHAVGAVVVADCAQSIAHMPVDVKALGVDFAAFSAHKMYGPMGIGVLYGRRELLDKMDPFRRGGGMVEAVFEKRTLFAEPPARFEAGTPNVEGAVGLAEAIQFMSRIGYDSLRAHENELTKRMLDGLLAIPEITLYGEQHVETRLGAGEPNRCGVVAFGVKGVSALDVAEAFARENIAVRAGAHYAEPFIRHLEQRSLCRASLALYTTEEDVDRFLEAAEQIKHNVMLLIVASMH